MTMIRERLDSENPFDAMIIEERMEALLNAMKACPEIPQKRKVGKRGKKKKREQLDPKNAIEAMIIEKRMEDLLNAMKACPEHPKKRER